MVQLLDKQARTVFDAVHPSSASEAVGAEKASQSLHKGSPIQTLRNGPVGSVLVALDRDGLVHWPASTTR